MAITDDLDGERRAVARAATPGVAPKPAAGTAFGTALRTGAMGAGIVGRQKMGAAAAGVGSAASAVTAPIRGALGFARDAGRAAAGVPASPNAGRPLGMPSLSVPSFPQVVPKRPASTPVTASPTAAATSPPVTFLEDGTRMPDGALVRGAPKRDFLDVTSRVLPGAPAAPAPAAGAGLAGIQRTVDAAGNAVYSDTSAGLAQGVQLANAKFGTGGDRRAAPGSLTDIGQAGPTAAVPAVGAVTASRPTGSAIVGTPAPVVAPRPAPAQVIRGRQGAVIQNPNDTLVDKLTRAMGSASLKGSPGSRAAVAQAILGEAGAARDERMQTLRTQDHADLTSLQANAVSAENAANRQLEASKANAQMADNAAGRGNNLEISRLARRPEISVSADGSMGIVGPDGEWRPVTGADGVAVRAPQAPRQTGELTDGERLKSYTDRYNAIASGMGTAEEKAASVAALDADPLYSSLRSGSTASPTFEQFLADAKQKGTKMSEADLRTYYDQNYGQ